MKFDLHVHSNFSKDGKSSIYEIANAARKAGLDGVAVCDHNLFHKHTSNNDIIFIPACEMSTDCGHLTVFFLKYGLENTLKQDEKGRFCWQEVIKSAHEQDALVFAAHPFCPEPERPDEFWNEIDGIEIFNSRIEHSRLTGGNLRAQKMARERNKPFSAGSDAHFPEEIGSSWWECDVNPDGMTNEQVLEEVKKALKSGSGRVYGGIASGFYRPASKLLKAVRCHEYKKMPGIFLRFGFTAFSSAKRSVGFSHKTTKGYINFDDKE